MLTFLQVPVPLFVYVIKGRPDMLCNWSNRWIITHDFLTNKFFGDECLYMINLIIHLIIIWLPDYSKYDLYSKSKAHVDVEAVKPYYQSLIQKVLQLTTKRQGECLLSNAPEQTIW